jgi:hypothetical protein
VFSKPNCHENLQAVLVRRLFAQFKQAFHHALPKHPLTAPTHTPLGVWAGRQLSRCRQAHNMRHRDGDAIKRTAPWCLLRE